MLAVIVAVPSATASTTPPLVTVATVSSSELQVIVAHAGVVVATSVAVSPTSSASEVSLSTMLVSVPSAE